MGGAHGVALARPSDGLWQVGDCLYAVLAVVMVGQWISPTLAACLGAGWTLAVFVPGAVQGARAAEDGMVFVFAMLRQDRLWAGVLSGAAVFMMYYFY